MQKCDVCICSSVHVLVTMCGLSFKDGTASVYAENKIDVGDGDFSSLAVIAQ